MLALLLIAGSGLYRESLQGQNILAVANNSPIRSPKDMIGKTIGVPTLGMILLFHGMQSSLSMGYDREMGVMRLLLTAPLPRWVLLACKLVAGTALSVITCYVFLAVCIPFDVTFDPIDWFAVLPALIISGLMLGALWLFLSVYIQQVENFAGAMNFVMFPMFFFSSALYPFWRLREGGSELLYDIALANPFTHAVELIRFALYGELQPVAAQVAPQAFALRKWEH